ncbi:MAG: hypothetical protein HKM89_06795 [Gemmatimonadales bacterium]|nr:hypothetical protein [Gemmatimonadales bacterium]
MGVLSLVVLATLPVQVAQSDSSATFADRPTEVLVRQAIARHHSQDSAVSDYRARLTYRLSFSLGKRRWARIPVASVEEQEALVQWRHPNDIKVDVVGRRARARSDQWKIQSLFDKPWFVPRGLGDSVSFFANEVPERAALHPFARDGPQWYRYALVDSLAIATPDGNLRVAKLEVLPKREGLALVAGAIWVDAATAQVVRFTFRFVGTGLWSVPDKLTKGDSAAARRENAIINRILRVDADLEYGQQDGRYWMPFRQVISGTIEVPLITDIVVPFEATTMFDDYVINTGETIAFTVPMPDSAGGDVPPGWEESRGEWRARARNGREGTDDAGVRPSRDYAGTWGGGRFQIHYPPSDSLDAYAGWLEPLVLDRSGQDEDRILGIRADLERLTEGLSSDMTGRRRAGIAYERFADILRFNRVQGLSAGLGYRWRVPGTTFTTLHGTTRFGLSDARLLARLSLIRDGPGGRWSLSAYRDLRELDPFFRVKTAGNSLNALFAAHDNADYFLAQGGSVQYETSLARGWELRLTGRIEGQSSVPGDATSGLNDVLGGSGDFPANPAIRDGLYGALSLGLEGLSGSANWRVGLEGLAGEGDATGRLVGYWRQPLEVGGGLTFQARAGLASRPTLPQSQFRLGGLQSVRGFDYGTGRGQAMWAAQMDWALNRNWVRPVLFMDAGQVGPADGLFDERVLVGAGVGISALRGLVRLDLSAPLSSGASGLRIDLVFGAPR